MQTLWRFIKLLVSVNPKLVFKSGSTSKNLFLTARHALQNSVDLILVEYLHDLLCFGD